MRRLPVYFLLDVSDSMVGEPIEELDRGLRLVIQELQVDPYALETAFVSVIAFAGKVKCLLPLTELTQFRIPKLGIGGGTSLGGALNFLVSELDRSIVTTTREVKGDWKPIIFLFTDGVPTDDVTGAIKKWNSTWGKKSNLVAVSIGNSADVQLLGRLTSNVLRLSTVDQASFRDFFKWVSASIKTSSVSVTEYSSDELRLPPTSGINLEKVNPNKAQKVDENYAILSARCSTTKEMYLIKYARQAAGDMYGLVGAYKIDENMYASLSDATGTERTIDSTYLYGQPNCPCCGTKYSMTRCGACGKVSCFNQQEEVSACPWCGTKAKMHLVDKIEYSRQKG